MSHSTLIRQFLLLSMSQSECLESQSSIWNRYSEFFFHIVLTRREMEPMLLRPYNTQTVKANRSTGIQKLPFTKHFIRSYKMDHWKLSKNLKCLSSVCSDPALNIFWRDNLKMEENLKCSLKKASISEKCLAH